MKLFTWMRGRQRTCRYYKLCFLWLKIGSWGLDGYILRYPAKAHLMPHKDPINGKMWRINVTLWGKCYFRSSRELLKIGQFIHVFRPDISTHSLYSITRTTKLSIGIAKLNKSLKTK